MTSSNVTMNNWIFKFLESNSHLLEAVESYMFQLIKVSVLIVARALCVIKLSFSFRSAEREGTLQECCDSHARHFFLFFTLIKAMISADEHLPFGKEGNNIRPPPNLLRT